MLYIHRKLKMIQYDCTIKIYGFYRKISCNSSLCQQWRMPCIYYTLCLKPRIVQSICYITLQKIIKFWNLEKSLVLGPRLTKKNASSLQVSAILDFKWHFLVFLTVSLQVLTLRYKLKIVKRVTRKLLYIFSVSVMDKRWSRSARHKIWRRAL